MQSLTPDLFCSYEHTHSHLCYSCAQETTLQQSMKIHTFCQTNDDIAALLT